MRRHRDRIVVIGVIFLGIALVTASVVVPTVLLLNAGDRTLNRWSLIGQALSPVGVFFSGIAFIGIALTLALQQREIRHQREQFDVAQHAQQVNSEVTLRQLHTDLIKMAIADPELRQVWPPVTPGVDETKKDHYCNLILNLQKVAFEAHTVSVDELRGALRYLMLSPDIYKFWQRSRMARLAVTQGDPGEDFFTHEVDKAFAGTEPPQPDRSSLVRFGAAVAARLTVRNVKRACRMSR